MVHKNLSFKIRHGLSINRKDAESLSIELISNTVGNTLFSVLDRPPNGRLI